MNELSTDKITYDPNTGRRFVYVGAGKSADNPDAIVAYSPSDVNGRAVAFADGSVQTLSAERFQEALQRDAAVPRVATPASPQEAAQTITAAAAPASPQPTAPAQPPPQQPGQTVVFANRVAAGGASGGAGGAVVATPPPKATATGVRPIRIEVPRTGQSFTFTKVLNAGQEPLTAAFSTKRLKVYRAEQMVLQASGFVLGLVMLWVLSLRRQRSAFWMTVALVLILWSVQRLMTMWRVLHVGLIAAVPILLFLVVAWAVWKFQHRRKAAETSAPYPPPSNRAVLRRRPAAGPVPGSSRPSPPLPIRPPARAFPTPFPSFRPPTPASCRTRSRSSMRPSRSPPPPPTRSCHCSATTLPCSPSPPRARRGWCARGARSACCCRRAAASACSSS